MRGETILSAFLTARDQLDDRYILHGAHRARMEIKVSKFYAELKRRLNAYDEAMNARVAERFMSQAMASAVTDFDFFTAVVNRINLDAVKVKELEKQRDDCRAAVHGMFGVDFPSEPSE